MDLSLERASEVSLGTQLIWKLRTLIATGVFTPGSKLPGIRELAEDAGVNVNTVRGALARLEEQGLLVSEHGRGTFVSSGVRPDQLLLETRDAAIASARSAGVDPRALAAALFISAGDASPVQPSDRATRRELYTEIAGLERELGKLDPLGSLDVRPGPSAPRILSIAELTQVRDDLVGKITELRLERDRYRAEQAEERERATAQPAGASRWRHAGVWTGAPAVRVSWTVP